jgi:hypothetical protein
LGEDKKMDRRQERFEAIRGLCVRFSTSNAPNITRLAEIIDIGMGGVAIGYRSRKNNTEGLAELTILSGNGRSAAGVTLPCRRVYDYDCELARKGCDCMPPMRRCGVEIEKLSKRQARQLKNFIRDHAAQNVPGYEDIRSFQQSNCSCIS